MLRQNIEKTLQEQNIKLQMCYIDLEKTRNVCRILLEWVDKKQVEGFRNLYKDAKNCVQIISKQKLVCGKHAIFPNLQFTVVFDKSLKIFNIAEEFQQRIQQPQYYIYL